MSSHSPRSSLSLLGVVLVASAMSSVSLSSQGQAAPPEWPDSYTEEQAARGESVYAANCQACHLEDLHGGRFAPGLVGADFITRWDARGDLLQYIQFAMPLHSPDGLRPQQNADVLAYLLQRSGVAAGPRELPPLDLPTVVAEVADTHALPDAPASGRYYTDEQALRGELAYNRNCGFCHGGGFSGDFLQREVHGTRVWPSVYYFFKKLEAMPAFDTDAISQHTRADIAAYILKQNGYPSGLDELSPDYTSMKAMMLDEPGFQRLFNGRDFTGFKFALRPNCGAAPDGCVQTHPGTTFSVRDGSIYCDCKIHGYMYTAQQYLYFDLRFDYRWERPEEWEGPPWLFQPSNGTFIFVQEPSVWPKGIEVEGHERDLLQIYALQTRLEKQYDPDAVRSAQHDIGEWNSIRIVSSRDGTVRSYVNGVLGSTITQHEFAALGGGHIAFQSQGGKIMWRNIRIQVDDTGAP